MPSGVFDRRARNSLRDRANPPRPTNLVQISLANLDCSEQAQCCVHLVNLYI